MPVPTAADVGPKFDLLLATRDGTSLTCKNALGQNVSVSTVAYMQTADKAKPQLEETELEHKGRLTQLSSPNLIDREFDQWPQVTQGDWSGGTYQRVFSGTTPISGGLPSDPSRYWDGVGLLWPVNDWLPQQGIANLVSFVGIGAQFFGTVGGFVSGTQSGPGYGWALRPQGGTVTVKFQAGDTSLATAASPLGVGIMPSDMAIAFGILFTTSYDGGTAINLDGFTSTGAGVLGKVASSPLQIVNDAVTVTYLKLAAAEVANKLYVAVAISYNNGAAVHVVKIFEVTTAGLNAPPAVTLQLPTTGAVTVNQMVFEGDSLIISTTDGQQSTIVSYNIAAATFSTLAQIPGAPNAFLCSVGGGLFIVAGSQINSSPVGFSIDMYVLTGGALQHVGPLQATQNNPFFTNFSRPYAVGPYVFWMAEWGVSFSNGTVAVYAYDLIRGRLFKAFYQTNTSTLIALTTGYPMAVMSGMVRSIQITGAGGTSVYRTSIGVALPLPASLTGHINEIYWGLQVAPFTTPNTIVTATDLISSLIDFTASSNKLFRQVLASHDAITVSGQTVTLNAWLDKDPYNLPASPDFTVTHAFSVSDAMPKQTPLLINTLARKIVYEVVTSGPFFVSTTLVNSPKIVSVAVQASTGWVQTLAIDLSPNVKMNGQQDYAYSAQGIDPVVAYNFLRQLWRQKGGEVTASFPNGDSGPWLIQDMHFTSPKPFAANLRSDQASQYQTIMECKLREDL